MKFLLPVSKWIWRQSWIPMRLKKSAYRIIGRYEQQSDAPFTTDFFGLTYEGNLRDGIEFALYFYGAFEKPLLFFMRDALTALRTQGLRGIYCDIGANIGQHALFMSLCAEQVHAFEPFPAVRSRLDHHISLNKLTNITVHSIALGDSNGEFEFFAPTGSNRGIGSFLASTKEKGNVSIGKLEVAKGDDYYAEQNLEPVQLIKIDVEGLEKSVLSGLKNTLINFRPVIVCEVTYGESQSFHSLEEFMSTLPDGYLIYRFNTRKPNGKTARRRGARAKRTGNYELQAVTRFPEAGQDDLVAIPEEHKHLIPLTGPRRGASGP